MVKNLPANVGGAGDMGLIPGLGRSSVGGNSNPLQYFCLGNPMDRGAWWATVNGVIELDRTEQLSICECMCVCVCVHISKYIPTKLFGNLLSGRERQNSHVREFQII